MCLRGVVLLSSLPSGAVLRLAADTRWNFTLNNTCAVAKPGPLYLMYKTAVRPSSSALSLATCRHQVILLPGSCRCDMVCGGPQSHCHAMGLAVCRQQCRCCDSGSQRCTARLSAVDRGRLYCLAGLTAAGLLRCRPAHVCHLLYLRLSACSFSNGKH